MIVRRAEKIYVVATPEVPSLFLMRRRILEVTERGVDKERISVLLNRCTGGNREIQDVQEILHRPVTLALPNDYNRVCQACLEGGRCMGLGLVPRLCGDRTDGDRQRTEDRSPGGDRGRGREFSRQDAQAVWRVRKAGYPW